MRRRGHCWQRMVCDRLVKDAGGSKARVRAAFASLVANPILWSWGDRRLKRYVLLERLGFSKGMGPCTVAHYWSKLIKSGIIDFDWNYKLAVILRFGLGYDPRTWLELQRASDGRLSYKGVAGKVNALLAARGLGMRVTQNVVISFIEALKREPPVPPDSEC
ncbi:MAG: hypothetical protein Q8N84_03515 [bacterium]|nr:hypothetical protein [bacterium]